MTKQEQIEEITSIIDSDICDKDCPNRCPYCGGLSSQEAENIYNAGYRKANDVRKETAKEILQYIKNSKFPLTADIYVLCEKYGVEVEE